MIPRVIHYCWFGRNPKPKLAKICIESWKKYCPDYKIVEWNEDNFDISACPLYVRQAYEAKKWAFVSDYARLKIIYENGGIYLDTDVELIKPLDPFLRYNAFFGFEAKEWIATGLGFGAVKGMTVLYEMMQDYEGIPFYNEDGSLDMVPCPYRNTKALIRRGLKQDDSYQVLDENIHIFSTEYFDPVEYETKLIKKTKKTVSIHYYSGSWYAEEKKREKWDRIVHIPHMIGRKLLGDALYESIKQIVKR